MRLTAGLLLLTAACLNGDNMLERDEQVVDDQATGTFAAFFACMAYDDFVASNMQSAWSMDPVAAFAQLQTRTYVQLQYFSYDRAADVVDVNEDAVARAPKTVSEATYDLYERTQVRLAAGCR